LGELTYQQSLILQQQASMLLSIDQPLRDTRLSMFFPSKLLDYFLARRTIMAITNPVSATDQILNSLQSKVFYYDNLQSMTLFFKEATVAFQNKNKSFFEVQALPLAYDAKTNASRLAELLLTI
jgi:hypothetical protein